MNWNSRYISVNEVIAKVYRDMKVESLLNPADAIEWAGEAIELIGAAFSYIEKVERLEITNYRAKLPCDLHYIVTTKGKPGEISEDPCDVSVNGYSAMRYSTNAFHHAYCANNRDHSCHSDLTYKVSNDYIFTNFETGYVLMAYKGIPVDNDGYPLIPDDIKFKEAVAGHIKWRIAFLQAAEGKMPQWVYQKLEQDRDFYIGAANTRSNMPSLDMAESIKNNWVRLIPKINQHADGFNNAGSREQRYTHTTGDTTPSQNTEGSTDTFFNIVVNS